MTYPPTKQESHKQIAVVLVLLAVHIFAGTQFYKFEIANDGTEYVVMAEHMLAGNGFTFDGVNPVVGKPPGLSAVAAMYIALVGSLHGFQILQLLLLFIGYLAVARLTQKLFGSTIAMFVLIALVALHPVRLLAANVLSEPLYIASFSWGVALFYEGLTLSSVRICLIAGLLLGGATYVRPLPLFWPAFLLVVTLLAMRDKIRLIALTAVVHLIIVAPWLIRVHDLTGRFTPMMSNWGPYLVMSEEHLMQQFSRSGMRDVHKDPHFVAAIETGFLFNQPAQEILREATIRNWQNDPTGCFYRCLRQTAFAWTYVPGSKEWEWRHPFLFWAGRLGMLGFVLVTSVGLWRLWRHDRAGAILIASLATYTALSLFPVSSESRYLVPTYILLLPGTANGVVHLISRFKGWRQ